MTPQDVKMAKCSGCEFYYNKVDASSPLGWCRNGYGRAIHILQMCPKLAEKIKAKQEREAAKQKTSTKIHKMVKPNSKKKTRRVVVEKTTPTVVVKAKKTLEIKG